MKQPREGAKEATATGSWLYSLFHNSNDPIAFADINGNFQTINRAFEDMTGYSQDELAEQKTFMDITPKKYAAFEAQQVRRVIETGVSTEYEKEYIRKDGSHVPILLNVFPIKNEAGEPIGTGAIFKDLTERKRFEQNLRLQGMMMANMIEGVYLLRASDGTIVYTNPKFDQIFGYEAGELTGKHVSAINAPTDKSPEQITKGIIAALDKNGVWTGEVLSIRKDGTLFWCHGSVSSFDHPD
ncbi:MAG: PAS domain S-box protein, partial [Actinomycetia bacterium]|nr:PAS domain S-box protein [Actinomycetes bacterium]